MNYEKYKEIVIRFVKQYKKIIVVNIVFVSLVAIVLVAFSHNIRIENIVLPAPPTPKVAEDYVPPIGPQKILIPKFKIDVSIEPVGIAVSGNMAVPRSFDRAGWYKYGAEPGEIGNAVIAGHLDNGGGKPGVFYYIKDLQVGDDINIVGHDGEETQFTVREVRTVDYQNAPLKEVFGESLKANLVLITCDGTWVQSKKMYTDRLIVFADKVE